MPCTRTGVRAVLRVERALPAGRSAPAGAGQRAPGPARGARPRPLGRRCVLGRGRLTGLSPPGHRLCWRGDRRGSAIGSRSSTGSPAPRAVQREPPARAARAAADGLAGRVAAAGCAGHVLDYDDTYAAGLVHASAPVAPVALLLAAERGLTLAAALDAYAAGFEATAALARASHPALYERGWHPTSVCGVVGAAVAAARLLGLEPEQERAAERHLVAARGRAAGGVRHATARRCRWGTPLPPGWRRRGCRRPGRSVAGRHRCRLRVRLRGDVGDARRRPAMRENWIKAYPCCLMTHAAIDAAQALRAGGVPAGEIAVAVHPTARRAAPCDDPADGLQAKFSIPYTTAHTLLHGPPGVESFAAPDAAARSFAAERVRVRTDAAPARDGGAARGRTGRS